MIISQNFPILTELLSSAWFSEMRELVVKEFDTKENLLYCITAALYFD